MSWNLIIYKTGKEAQIEPLGDLGRVTDALNASFIDLEWQSPTAAALPVEGGFRATLTMQGRKVQDIYIDGGFNHIRQFAGLCTREGWRLADAQEGEDIDLRDPQKVYEERRAQTISPRTPGRATSPTSPLQGQRPARETPKRFEWIIWLLVLVGLAALAFYLWYRRGN